MLCRIAVLPLPAGYASRKARVQVREYPGPLLSQQFERRVVVRLCQIAHVVLLQRIPALSFIRI